MGASILVVEDEPYIVESLTFLLEREGHRVTAALDGDAAVEAIARLKPDLIVLDIMLPKRNGFEVLSWIRGNEATRDARVLVLTAKGQEPDRRKAEELGADVFVTKPFSNREVMRQVNALLAAAPAAGATTTAPR